MEVIGFDKEECCYFPNDNETPLHYASQNGHHEIVKYLIDKGADMNAKGPVRLRRIMELLLFFLHLRKDILRLLNALLRKEQI